VFFSLQNFFSCYEKQQLILETGTAIWWVAEPYLMTLHIGAKGRNAGYSYAEPHYTIRHVCKMSQLS
jgi:hypothetical protein